MGLREQRLDRFLKRRKRGIPAVARHDDLVVRVKQAGPSCKDIIACASGHCKIVARVCRDENGAIKRVKGRAND